jgi:outer membrane protein
MKKLLLAFALVASSAVASELHIGVIDMNQVIQTAPQMVKIQATLDKTFSPRHQAIMSKVNQVKADNENLLKNANVMKDKDRIALTKKINEQRNTIMELQGAFQQDYENARSTALKGLFDQINGVTKKIASEKHYDLILNSSTTPFANNHLDITDTVVARLKKS